MKSRTQIALPLFEFAGLLAVFLTGWVASRLYEITPGADEDRGQNAELREAFFRIEKSVQTNFPQLDNALTNVLKSKDAVAIDRFPGKNPPMQNRVLENEKAAARIQFESRRLEWEKWLAGEIQLANPPDDKMADSYQPRGLQEPMATKEFNGARRKLIPLLMKIQEAYTNYLGAAKYLMANEGGLLLRGELAKRGQTIRNRRAELLKLADLARAHGQAINDDLTRRENHSQALKELILRLRVALLLAVLGAGSLWLLGRHRRKQSEASEAVRRHSEQQGKLDRLAYFSSQLAQEHAHEIKQPLTAINAHLYTLQKTLAAGAAPHKDATVIRSEINRLDQIVEKFLKQARSTESEPVDLTAEKVLSEVRDLMATHLKQQAIEFKFEVEEVAGFRADPRQLKQVLINLVKNAAESISQQGVITLRAKRGTCQSNGHAGAATILEVEDTGGGIPVEIQGKIFDPFFSTKKQGSGLGLAISARIIEQHGGRLEFDSHIGQGTIFRIMLPARSEAQTP